MNKACFLYSWKKHFINKLKKIQCILPTKEKDGHVKTKTKLREALQLKQVKINLNAYCNVRHPCNILAISTTTMWWGTTLNYLVQIYSHSNPCLVYDSVVDGIQNNQSHHHNILASCCILCCHRNQNIFLSV